MAENLLLTAMVFFNFKTFEAFYIYIQLMISSCYGSQ